MNVSLLILTFNRKDILSKLLKEIAGVKELFYEVIVVDNNSSDGTPDLFNDSYVWVDYIVTRENIGVAARNISLKKASGDLIITIDDDIFGIDKDAINNLVGFFRENKLLGAVNFRVIDAFNGSVCNWVHHRKVEIFADKDFQTYEITEGAVAFRRKIFEKSGYYPDYFFISHEGPDLAYRIINAGFDVVYSPTVTVKHLHAQQGRKTWFRYYYDTRNQFWLAARNFPLLYSIKYLSVGVLSTLIYSIRDGFFKYWFKGVCDGIKGIPRSYKDRVKLSKRTMKKIKEIDRSRPSFLYMVRKRFFNRGMRL